MHRVFNLEYLIPTYSGTFFTHIFDKKCSLFDEFKQDLIRKNVLYLGIDAMFETWFQR